MNAARPEPDEGPPVRQVLLLLERLYKQLATRLERVLAQERLGMAEWLIVSEIAATGEVSLTHIAQRLSRDPGSLSRAITRLIQRELLGSMRNGPDRRRATLSLTAAGLALHVRLAQAIERIAWAEPAAIGWQVERVLALLETAGSRAGPPARLPRPPSVTRRSPTA